jgi:hypothetical protein
VREDWRGEGFEIVHEWSENVTLGDKKEAVLFGKTLSAQHSCEYTSLAILSDVSLYNTLLLPQEVS